jgi:hypothetical protein
MYSSKQAVETTPDVEQGEKATCGMSTAVFPCNPHRKEKKDSDFMKKRGYIVPERPPPHCKQNGKASL